MGQPRNGPVKSHFSFLLGPLMKDLNAIHERMDTTSVRGSTAQAAKKHHQKAKKLRPRLMPIHRCAWVCKIPQIQLGRLIADQVRVARLGLNPPMVDQTPGGLQQRCRTKKGFGCFKLRYSPELCVPCVMQTFRWRLHVRPQCRKGCNVWIGTIM